MSDFKLKSNRPGLLVSVRSAEEARIALAAGVDVIDVKEPSRGSLGAADAGVVAEVADIVKGRVPMSVALGELLEADRSEIDLNKVAFAKLGLAGCGTVATWTERWRYLIATWPETVEPVAVVYADWRLANAPSPEEVLREASAMGVQFLLVDTWEKTHGDLFDHWPRPEIEIYFRAVRAAGMRLVLAGSLGLERMSWALACDPDLVAVRGAVCEGGRTGSVSATRLRTLHAALRREASARSDRMLSPLRSP